MRDQTKAFIQRPYEEIVNDILTAMLGGVTNEPILFDVKTDGYALAQPAQSIRSISGIVPGDDPELPDGVPNTFIQGTDFNFDAGRNEVVWLEDGQHPKDDTLFYVDYLIPDSRSPLTDINIGSVTRTISEAIGREIATLYQQMNLVYESAFIDTATGKSLDLVVAILGIERRTRDYAEGLITFFRDPSADGNISILQGTRVTTEKRDVIFETTEPRTLQRGQVRIGVPARAATRGEVGNLAANSLTKLFQEIEGVSRVTNFEATLLGTRDETDEELRRRAKAALRSLGKGTLIALNNAVIENRGKVLDVWDPNKPPNRQSEPGQVTMLIETEPERFAGTRARVNEVRAAGVSVLLQTRYVFMTPRLVVTIAKGEFTAQGKQKLISEVIAALQGYVDELTGSDPANGKAMQDRLEEDVEGVKAFTFVDVLTAVSDTDVTEEDELAQRIIDEISNIDDPEQRKARLKTVLSETPPLIPSGARKARRDLVKALDDNGNPTAEQATDADIEEANFAVVPEVDDETWFITLEMVDADIALVEED